MSASFSSDMHRRNTSIRVLASSLEAALGIGVLAPEYEIVLNLYEDGETMTGTLQGMSRFSHGTFYSALRRLEQVGAVLRQRDDQDRRRSHYNLTPEVRLMLDHEFAQLDGIHQRIIDGQHDGEQVMSGIIQRIERSLRIRVFTCEYKILLTLFEDGALPSSQIARRCGSSAATFYAAMGRLRQLNLIGKCVSHSAQESGPDCGTSAPAARQPYCLLPTVRQSMGQILLPLDEWISTRVGLHGNGSA